MQAERLSMVGKEEGSEQKETLRMLRAKHVCMNGSLVPRSVRRFLLHERTQRKGPGMFPHMRDIEGRKVVERNMDYLGLRTAKVPAGNLPCVSGLAGGDSHTHQALNV